MKKFLKNMVGPVFLALCIAGPVFAADSVSQDPFKSAFAFGLQTGGTGTGVSIKLRLNDSTRIQGVTWFTSDYAVQGSSGLRVIRNLGYRDGVSRYYGAGAGIAFHQTTTYPDTVPKWETPMMVQGFLGLEIPWAWTGAGSAISALNTSLEVGMGANMINGGIKPKTSVNFGLHYNF